jgi:hypothetical protein
LVRSDEEIGYVGRVGGYLDTVLVGFIIDVDSAKVFGVTDVVIPEGGEIGEAEWYGVNVIQPFASSQLFIEVEVVCHLPDMDGTGEAILRLFDGIMSGGNSLENGVLDATKSRRRHGGSNFEVDSGANEWVAREGLVG